VLAGSDNGGEENHRPMIAILIMEISSVDPGRGGLWGEGGERAGVFGGSHHGRRPQIRTGTKPRNEVGNPLGVLGNRLVDQLDETAVTAGGALVKTRLTGVQPIWR
jgi:hypothetical protein